MPKLKIRKMKHAKNNVENIGTRQRFSAGNPEIALSALFHPFFGKMSWENFDRVLPYLGYRSLGPPGRGTGEFGQSAQTMRFRIRICAY